MDAIAFWPSFLKMLLALILVMGLLVGAMYFFKRVLQQTTAGPHDHGAINIVTSRYLGPKSSIMLIDVLGTLIVIGITANQMSHLATISDVGALEKLKAVERRENKFYPLADHIKKHKIFRILSDRMGKGIGRA